jgi:hypothetical protein
MADDKDRYVQGRGNPSLDPTRTDLSQSAFTRDKNGTLVEKSKLASQNAAIDAREKSGFSRNINGMLTPTADLAANNRELARMSESGFARNINGMLTPKADLEANNRQLKSMGAVFGGGQYGMENENKNKVIPIFAKTEHMPPQRDLSGGGAKSGVRIPKKLSSFGRSAPYDSYAPSPIKSGFLKEAISSVKHFVPQFGLFGTGFHGSPMRIQAMKFIGGFPVMDVTEWSASSASTTYTEDEDNE